LTEQSLLSIINMKHKISYMGASNE